MTDSQPATRAVPFSGSDTLPRKPLTQAHYTSREWYDHDLEAVFKKHWLFAGHASQISKPGDFFTFEVGNESVIVSRTKGGDIKAFHNSCRHRGTQVCQKASGRAKYFVCPFHGWAYDLDGSLTVAPEMPATLDKAKFPLKPVWLEAWEGLIFLSLSTEQPKASVADSFAHIDLSAYQLDRTKVIADRVYEVGSNWKIVGETAQECYHCSLTHPELVRVINPLTDMEAWEEVPTSADSQAPDYLMWTPDAGPGMREGAVTFSIDGQLVSKRLLGNGDVQLPCAALAWFPQLQFFTNPDHAYTLSWLPVSPTKSLMRATWVVHEDAVEGVDYDIDRVVALIDVTNDQDKDLCGLVQTGVNSSGYDNSAPYQPELEAPIRGFLGVYLDRVKDGQPTATGAA